MERMLLPLLRCKGAALKKVEETKGWECGAGGGNSNPNEGGENNTTPRLPGEDPGKDFNFLK
jgi:hypothetical protein